MTDVETECVRRIAAAKGIATDGIGPDTTLASLEVDSLDRVSLSFDLEEEYGVEIPERELYSIQTVGDVASAIERALLDKQNAAPSSAGAV